MILSFRCHLEDRWSLLLQWDRWDRLSQCFLVGQCFQCLRYCLWDLQDQCFQCFLVDQSTQWDRVDR